MRHDNNGLRKLCEHPRRAWAGCSHAWYFNFKWKEKHYRLSLDKHLDHHVDSKSDAIDAAAEIRKSIKAGTFGVAAPVLDNLTVQQLLDLYDRRYLQTKRAKSAGNLKYQMGKIAATLLPLATGGVKKAFGAWFVADVTTDTIKQFEETRRPAGLATTNRDLSFLRAMCSWAVTVGYLQTTPFKRGTEIVVKLSKEHGRRRRLQADEEAPLLAACGAHLRGIIEAAIETGMRKGEILGLLWEQVEGMTVDEKAVTWAPRAELFLPWGKTKTERDRRIPISTRLKSILEMRRFDPAGNPHALDAYVFGTEIGTRLLGFSRAWRTAVLRSHGHTPAYTKTANLTPESRAALRAVGLHFHDLRREAGSRWLDGGVPLHTIRDWLGHSNIAQTSTYLAGTAQTQHDAMTRFEAQQAALQRIATEVKTGGRKRLRTTAKRERKLNKTAVGHDTPIM